jgi:hypothetical protein
MAEPIEAINETSFLVDGELVDLNEWRRWALAAGGGEIHGRNSLFALLQGRYYLLLRACPDELEEFQDKLRLQLERAKKERYGSSAQ